MLDEPTDPPPPVSDEADLLEELARRVQSDDAPAEDVARLLQEFQDRYHRWYEEALLLLPDELGTRFREQYEGSIARPRIKQYVREPRKPWSLYDRMPQFLRGHGPWQYPFQSAFLEPFREQRRLLALARRHPRAAGRPADAVALLTDIARRLPTAIPILQRPLRDRPGLPVTDEYDVQRILHALLTLHFEDVRPEETTPSRAGGSYRIDFLLKRERLAVEAKMTNRSLTPTRVRDQLLTDIFGYQGHGDVDRFFAVVYDPTRRIGNPRGFEDDLSQRSLAIPVHVVVAQ